MSYKMVGLIIAVMVLPSIVLSQDDPCKNYLMLYDDGGRSIKCSRYYSDSHDRFITEGWRRVQLKSTREDLTMPTQCIQHGYCGSHSNVWLNGTHPTVEDGIVDRIGCLSMFSSCCKVQYPIQIKNCTDYMVYNLKRTFGSDERYCFGDSLDCYVTSVPSTVSTSTTTRLTTKTLRLTTKTTRPTTKTARPTSTTTRPTTKTTRPTTKTTRSITKTTRPTTKTTRSITKTSRPTTKTTHPTTMTTRPTTKTPRSTTTTIFIDNKHSGGPKTPNVSGNRVGVSEYETDEEIDSYVIVGTSVAAAVVFIIICLIIFYFVWKRRFRDEKDRTYDTITTLSQHDNHDYAELKYE